MFADVLEQPELSMQDAAVQPKILIVDDDDVLCDVLSDRLQRQGFQTATADTGRLGVEKARSQRPSLIVLDLQLPDVDGLRICEQLADYPETCTIPVIILSGTERPDVLRRSRAAGAQYYVRKPYDPNVLLVLIRRAISEIDAWETLES
jgi:CheY-like chemotaxis protein